MNKSCPCQSNKVFKVCCEPLINQQKTAKTPVQLMRSRYTAYALGGHGDYLLATWDKHTHEGLTAASLSLSDTKWLGLKILAKSQNNNLGSVEFKASYLGEQGETLVHHEKSEFRRVHGKWFYVGISET